MNQDMKRIGFAVAAGILATLGVAGLFGWIQLRQWVDMAHLDLMASGVLIVGSGITALSCGVGEGSVKRTVLSETGLILFLMLINLGLFEGELNGLIPCVIVIAGTAGAVMLIHMGKGPAGGKKTRRRRRQIGMLNKKYSR